MHSPALAAQRSWRYATVAILLGMALAACGGSSSSSSGTSGTSSVNLAQAYAALQKRITMGAPHVVNSGVVTAMNWPQRFSKFWDRLIPSAMASDLGLSLIWDPESGSPPLANDFAMQNPYIGSPSFVCNSSANTCTLGSVTVPEFESLTNYVGQEMDPNFQNSNGASMTVFGRLNTATMVVCAIGQLVPPSSMDTDGLPVAGSLTLNFPSDTTNSLYKPISSGGCGVSAQNAGFSISATVSAVSSPYYTKKLTLSIGNAISLWMKLDPTAGDLNFLSVEDQRPSGRYAVDRTIVSATGLNSSGTAQVRFEYISLGSNEASAPTCYAGGNWQCSFEFHRGFIDETADVAYLVSNIGSPGAADGSTGAPTSYAQWTAAAKPSELSACSAGGTCSATMALSFTADGQGGVNNTSYPAVGNEYDGCVNIASRALTSNATLACDLTGAGILATGGAAAMIETTRQTYVADVVATLLGNTTPSTTLSFTGASDIYTVADTH